MNTWDYDSDEALAKAESALARAYKAAIAAFLLRNPWEDVLARRRLLGAEAMLIGTEEAAEQVSAEFRRTLLAIALLLEKQIRSASKAGFSFDITDGRLLALFRSMEYDLVRMLTGAANHAAALDLPEGLGLGYDQVEQLLRQRGAGATARALAGSRRSAAAYQVERMGLWLGQQALQEAIDLTLRQAKDYGAIVEAWRTWITRGDEKVRSSHNHMHGQRKLLGQPFQSGLGNFLRFPGDPRAPDRDRRGCRCTLGISFA